jgi:molybdopterin biosynthesis enzyme
MIMSPCPVPATEQRLRMDGFAVNMAKVGGYMDHCVREPLPETLKTLTKVTIVPQGSFPRCG